MRKETLLLSLVCSGKHVALIYLHYLIPFDNVNVLFSVVKNKQSNFYICSHTFSSFIFYRIDKRNLIFIPQKVGNVDICQTTNFMLVLILKHGRDGRFLK